MSIREDLERMEQFNLSPYAALSMDSKGRLKEEEPCDIRPVFQRAMLSVLSCPFTRTEARRARICV